MKLTKKDTDSAKKQNSRVAHGLENHKNATYKAKT